MHDLRQELLNIIRHWIQREDWYCPEIEIIESPSFYTLKLYVACHGHATRFGDIGIHIDGRVDICLPGRHNGPLKHASDPDFFDWMTNTINEYLVKQFFGPREHCKKLYEIFNGKRLQNTEISP